MMNAHVLDYHISRIKAEHRAPMMQLALLGVLAIEVYFSRQVVLP